MKTFFKKQSARSKRFCPLLLCVILLIGIMTTTAFAEEVITTNGGNAVSDAIMSDDPTSEAASEDKVETIGEKNSSTQYIITDNEKHNFSGTVGPIVIESGSPTIILNGVTINAAGKNAPAIWIKAGATVSLQIEDENTLTGDAGYAAICVDPAYSDDDGSYSPDDSAKLIVSGSGSLKATGGNGDPYDGMFGGGAGIGGSGQNCDGEMGGVDFGIIEFSKQFTGTINAYGGKAYAVSGEFESNDCSFGGGAGIGSGGFDCTECDWGIVCGRITIQNGTIIANDGLANDAVGAGIGGGTGGLESWDTDSSDISIPITGGNITAQGGSLSAGIGGGSVCDGGNVKISGGTVLAKAGEVDDSLGASGIGGGNDGGLYRIDITGGQVTAIASGGSAGIGGASNTSRSKVQSGDMYGARSEGKVGIINISGKDTVVSAYGGTGIGSFGTYGGAGIGAGYPIANNDKSVAFDISIKDGATVNAYGGYHAQAVGYGYRPSNYTGYGIKLVLDDTISLWTQNYDCFQPALVAATEYDDNPITYKSDDKYLVSYVGEDKEATAATSGEAKGCLEWDNEATAQSFAWNYAEKKLSINGHEVRAIETMKGNWSTLYSTPKITVSYKWTTENKPTDVVAPADDVIEAGTKYTAKEQDDSMEGYRFDGWYTDEDCTKVYRNGSVLNNDTTLYGKWNKLCNVSYDPNGGGGTMTDSSSPYVSGASVTVMENAFVRDNYSFTGWNTASDGSGESYSAGDNFTIEDDITLYAQWKTPSDPTEPTNPSKPGEGTNPSDPTKPAGPTKPAESNPNAGATGSQTGDDTNVLLWLTLLAVSCCGLAGILAKRRTNR